MTFDDLTAVEKKRRHFTISAPGNLKFLTELRLDAEVDVDINGRIIRYEAHDESLKLQGSHSQSKKLGCARRTAKRAVADDVEEEEKQEQGPALLVPKRQRVQDFQTSTMRGK